MRLRGQLISLDRSYPLVRIGGEDVRAEYSAGFTRDALHATVGDWLALEQTGAEPAAQIVGVEERQTLLVRRQCVEHPSVGQGQVDEQALAANFDQVFVVAGLGRADFDLGYLERQLVAAYQSGAAVSVLLNKADLANQPLAEAAGEVSKLADGLQVLCCSALTGQGIDELHGLCPPGSLSVFFGRSGVGKSSLINALLGDQSQTTGQTRQRDQAGRHTTVARQMVFGGGKAYFDTPGIRTIGVYQQEDGLAEVFADVIELAGECRFRDCRHTGEPGCAVQAAVGEGALEARRLSSYTALASEVFGYDKQG